jgi:RNA polymerase sigma-70 factor (ECF subfamily)
VDRYEFDEEYLRRLREGDPSAEEHFAAYFGELLLIKLRARLHCRHLIEDIQQETLLRVVRALRQGGGLEQAGCLGAFVNSVCNHVLSEYRSDETRLNLIRAGLHDSAGNRCGSEGGLPAVECRRDVERMLAALSDKDRTLLRMVVLEDRDLSEVCRRFGVNEAYVRVMVHRAKLRLRKRFVERLKPAPPGALQQK